MKALAFPLLLLGLTPSASEGQEVSPAVEAPASEGALDNDVFVPTSEPAAKALASGDAMLERARTAAQESETGRLLDAAFDHWRDALVLGGPGASTWLDPSPGSERRVAEGVHAAVVRRWIGLAPAERERWTTRHEPRAKASLAEVHADFPPAAREARLAEIVRLHPLTPGATEAALELGDLAHEAGLRARARGWYARAGLEAELGGSGALSGALASRLRVLGPPPEEGVETWRSATAAELAGTFAWQDSKRGTSPDPSGDRWLRPGGAFLADHRFLLQTATEVLVFALPRQGELALEMRLRPGDFLGAFLDPIEPPREPPGWPLLPLVDEWGAVLVVGRTHADEPNALLALELLEPRRRLGLELGRSAAGARMSWAIVGAERIDALQGVTLVPELEELGRYEFQPGPVVAGERVVVQARQIEGQIRAWILAFDRRTGELAWKQLLASGADRVPTQRFGSVQRRVAGQPLLAFEADGEPRVFVGTHLGLGVLLDALAGEPLWSLKNRRRGEHDRGWSGDRPLLEPGAGNQPVVLWAPMDSDRLYALRGLPIAGAESSEAASVLRGAPAPLQEATALLGGGTEEWLVLGSAGRERTVSLRRPGRDRVDALDLGQAETFRGLGLVSPERAWVASSRSLYLFDRTRELYLLASPTLPPAGTETPGGDLTARGSDVLVLGSSALWWFRAR